MTVREIIRMGDPRLLRVAQPVQEFDSDELHLLVADMWETMNAEGGVGLAAPQIAVDLQVMVFGTGEPSPRYPEEGAIARTVLINPTIEALSDEQVDRWEGCLSIPGLRGEVPRWTYIRYSGFDLYGDPIEREVRGFHARVVQHEFDHLMGTLYPMRMRDMRKLGYTDVLFPELAR